MRLPRFLGTLLRDSFWNHFLLCNQPVDIFENRQLKQAMEYVDSQVILSTVHSANCLEWDHVILANMERWNFPGYFTCKKCPNGYSAVSNYRCQLPIPLPDNLRGSVLDELSVFYVGITRAKEQVYISASTTKINSDGTTKNINISCLSAIAGIKLVQQINEIKEMQTISYT